MSKGKEMSLAEAQSKIKEKFPNWSFQILSFELEFLWVFKIYIIL